MRHFLSGDCALKRLERPSVYRTSTDELYELDDEAFAFLRRCSDEEGCEAGEDDFTAFCTEEGLIAAERPVGRQAAPLLDAPRPSLRYLELQITRRCNLRCRHCYLGPAADVELPAQAVLRVLDEFQAMQGLRVLITGGEPLMHKGFREINAALPGYPLRKVLFTNGTLMTKELLSGLNVDEVQVSIDGLEAAHDALRGKGTFRRAVKCVEEARLEGFQVSVSTMVHRENLDDFEQMERLFKGMGIKDWTVDVPCAEGNLKQDPGLLPAPEEAARCLAFGFGSGLHGGAGEEGHACGLHLMAVMADGSCSKCAFYAGSPVGRIGEGLASCWGRVEHTRLDETECRGCAHIEVCRGGCRYRAGLLGSPRGKDLYRCALYGKIS